jgi:dual specificity phosphatase 3
MLNIDFITDRLATGGDLPSDRYDDAVNAVAELVELGVTHIVDNRIEWSDERLVARLAPQIAYRHNGVDDAGQRMPDRWFDTGVDFALTALEDPAARVVVHCHMGINRGPSMAYAILLALGWDPVEAIDAIRRVRPEAAVGYAEDAVRWHHRRSGATTDRVQDDRRRLAAWRVANPHDTVRIIREIRVEEARRYEERLADEAGRFEESA